MKKTLLTLAVASTFVITAPEPMPEYVTLTKNNDSWHKRNKGKLSKKQRRGK